MENQLTVTQDNTLIDPNPAANTIRSSYKFDYRVGKLSTGTYRVFFRSKLGTAWTMLSPEYHDVAGARAGVEEHIRIDGPTLDPEVEFVDLRQ